MQTTGHTQHDKVKMPILNCESLSDRFPGVTSAPASPQCPQSPKRKQFYDKYLEDSGAKQKGGRPQTAYGNVKVRNMVYANKKEREHEKNVCSYMVEKVLNQGNLTKITGITTKGDLERQANMQRAELQREAQAEADIQEAKMKALEQPYK